jgi:teichuronic acid biosynthesis glycosyltransferase TuaC
MRVLVCSNMYPTPLEPWRGCFVKEQVEDLQRAGVQVDTLAFDARGRKRMYARTALAIRERARDGYDLVHAHYGLTGAAALAQRCVPVVTTFHGSDTGYVRWQRPISWLVARLSQPIFVSRAGALDLRLPSAPVIPVAVDTERFQVRDRAEARCRLGWPVNTRYVLLPGSRSNPRKCGVLFDATLEEVRRKIDVEGVALEGFSREETAVVMNAVDATLMTSEWEGSPVAPRESLASGTPVVSVRVGDVEEVLAGLDGCATVEREPRALAAAVLRALATPGRHHLRLRAERYSRPKIAARILDLYEHVVACQARAAMSA